MDISKITKRELINLEMKAKTKEEALRELCDLLYQEGYIDDVEQFLFDVYERENEGQTGLGNHIAIPHGKSDAVIKTSIAIGRSKNDIPWESLDDKPVNCIILFAVKNQDKTTMHLRMLSQVAVALADDEILKQLLTDNEPEKIMQLFSSEAKV